MEGQIEANRDLAPGLLAAICGKQAIAMYIACAVSCCSACLPGTWRPCPRHSSHIYIVTIYDCDSVGVEEGSSAEERNVRQRQRPHAPVCIYGLLQE